MKRITIFLTLIGLLCAITTFTTLLKASPEANRGGTMEWEDPPHSSYWDAIKGEQVFRGPNYWVHRRAYDQDKKVWSNAATNALQEVLGHTVHARAGVYSARSPFLRGSYTVNAWLYHDWVHPNNTWDGETGQWQGYLNENAETSDSDWFDSYVPRDTIEKCLADGYANAKDIRTRSVSWRTNVYIPWLSEDEDGEDAQGNAGTAPTLGIYVADSSQTYQPGDSVTLNLVTNEAYYDVTWYVHTPWDTSSSGTYQGYTYGGGTSTETSFSYTFPSGSMHTGSFTFRAVIYRWSDMSRANDETYTITVE